MAYLDSSSISLRGQKRVQFTFPRAQQRGWWMGEFRKCWL